MERSRQSITIEKKEECAREKKQMEDNEWIKVEPKGRKQKVVKEPTEQVKCNNAYNKLTETNNNVSPPQDDEDDRVSKKLSFEMKVKVSDFKRS